ncbi:MAG: RagB/SusD family nutrient uptake outer membrane protein [Balneolales bacterium]
MHFNKTKFRLLAIMTGMLFLSSCDSVTEYLEAPETIDVTVDDIFSDRQSAESFLWEVYRTTMPQGFVTSWSYADGGMYYSMVVGATDEGDVYDGWPSSNNHNTGVWGPSNNQEDSFSRHYKGIRNANIFLENIDNVPNIPEAEKAEMKAEAVFLRAQAHQNLLKRYGAVPIVDMVLTATGDIMLPRNTYAEVVEFITKSTDDASGVLPDSYPPSHTGRITKGAALALKSRVLLYAASPLSNTDAPYLPENADLTGYGDYDAQRWNRAATASKAVLDWADGAGISLVTSSADPEENYRNAIEEVGNSELILATQSHGAWEWGHFRDSTFPRGAGGWYGHGVTLNHAEKYHRANGSDQVWPDSGPYSEFITKMEEMEPRFQYSVFYSGSAFNDNTGVRNMYTRNDGSFTNGEPFNGVGYMRKFLAKGIGSQQYHWIVYRLAESYLNYAEALNEVSPMHDDVYEALNAVRQRAGIPEVSNGDPGYSTQDDLRAAIWRERAIELAFEEHRFYDVRRWLIAEEEGVMTGEMWGIKIFEQADESLEYVKAPFEERAWGNQMYRYPLPQGEINKGYMEQNPGW